MKQVILDYIDFYTNSFKDEFIIEGEDQVIKIKIDVRAKEEYKITNEITEKTTLYPNGKVYSKAEYNKKGLKHGVEKILLTASVFVVFLTFSIVVKLAFQNVAFLADLITPIH